MELRKRTKLELTLVLIVAIVVACAYTAFAQSCVPVTFGGSVNATGNCNRLLIRFLNHNSVDSIDHFNTRWTADNVRHILPGNALQDIRDDVHCNWGSQLEVTQVLKNGASCTATSTTSPIPHTPDCALCSGGSGVIACGNAANGRDSQTDDAISALYSSVDMTGGATATAGNIPLPQSLLGVRVYVGNYEAGIFFVSSLQLNFWIPSGVPQGVQAVQVTTASGQSLYGTVNIQPNSPGIFTQTGNGQGIAASIWYVSRINGSSGYYSPGALPALNPTDQVFLILYGTSIKGSFSTLYLGNGKGYDSVYTGASGFVGLKQMNYPIPVSEVWRTTLGAFVRVWNGTTKSNGSWDSQGFDVR